MTIHDADLQFSPYMSELSSARTWGCTSSVFLRHLIYPNFGDWGCVSCLARRPVDLHPAALLGEGGSLDPAAGRTWLAEDLVSSAASFLPAGLETRLLGSSTCGRH